MCGKINKSRLFFNSKPIGSKQVKVFDVLEREVATLVNEAKEPGEYSVEWDASAAPSGVYYYRLTAGSFTDFKKMLLVTIGH